MGLLRKVYVLALVIGFPVSAGAGSYPGMAVAFLLVFQGVRFLKRLATGSRR